MELLPVRCNHCGASLKISGDARFVTCAYCKSELTVMRNEGAISTEVLQRIEQKTDRMADNLDVIRIQGELDLLDREWQMKRETMLVRDRRGKLIEPVGTSTLAGCAIAVVLAPIFSLLSIGSAFFKDNSVAVILTLMIVTIVIVNLARGKRRSPYKIALADYERRRARLMDQMTGQARPE
jgi:hypothetical protein